MTDSTSKIADDLFTPSLPRTGSQTSRSPLPAIGSSSGTASTATTNTLTQPTKTNGNNTTTPTNTIQFVNGYPFWYGLSVADTETVARRQYGPIVSNARNLIRAGIYPQAVTLLQRVIAAVPATRIGAEAQALLNSIPAP
jgi:hypothetical protein